MLVVLMDPTSRYLAVFQMYSRKTHRDLSLREQLYTVVIPTNCFNRKMRIAASVHPAG